VENGKSVKGKTEIGKRQFFGGSIVGISEFTQKRKLGGSEGVGEGSFAMFWGTIRVKVGRKSGFSQEKIRIFAGKSGAGERSEPASSAGAPPTADLQASGASRIFRASFSEPCLIFERRRSHLLAAGLQGSRESKTAITSTRPPVGKGGASRAPGREAGGRGR